MTNFAEISGLVERMFSRKDRCADDISRALRFLIEWISSGQPKDKKAEYISCMLPEFEDCDVDPNRLLSVTYTNDTLEFLITTVIDSFVAQRPNFHWCPYILKGVFSHDLVVKNYVMLLAVGWPNNEPLTLGIVSRLDCSRINVETKNFLTIIAENAKDEELMDAARKKMGDA